MANASTISSFLTALDKSGLRSNLFEVTIAQTNEFASTDDAVKNFRFLCRASSFPGMTVDEIPLPYFGRQVYFPGNIRFGTWNTRIVNDEGFEIRNKIEQWMEAINSHQGNVRSSTNITPGSLYGTATIKLYTVAPVISSNEPAAQRTITLEDCWPTVIEDIQLSYDSNAIEEFGVQWQFNYFTET